MITDHDEEQKFWELQWAPEQIAAMMARQARQARQAPAWRLQNLPESNVIYARARMSWFDGVDGLDLKTPRPHWKQPGLGLRSA